MKAEIISIGTELLLGHIVNTNTSYLSGALAEIGIDVFYHNTVGDNTLRLKEVVNRALGRSDIIITTGGLGPTVDDITLETLSAITGRRLVFKKDIFNRIKDNFRRRGFKIPKEAVRQAFIPAGALPIRNDFGTAPGLIIKKNDKILIALPGPPRELQPMVKKYVLPYLKRAITTDATAIIKSKAIKLMGLPESHINSRVKDLLRLSGDLTVGIYAHTGQVELKITCKEKNVKRADKKIKPVEKIIRKRFKNYIYGTDDETLESVLGRFLVKKKKTLAIAESCSGGYISNLITNVPGSSRYFMMGLTAYSNESKISLLRIDKELIKRNGAVSKETASAMAQNMRLLAKTDFALGVTGIAGPFGGTKKKPVGTVFIALSTKKKTFVKQFNFIGTRGDIKLQTALAALDMLRLGLIGHPMLPHGE